MYVDKQEVILTAREFSILELLMKNPHKVFTRANLLNLYGKMNLWEMIILLMYT